MTTIMLVDDHPIVRDGLRALLKTAPDFRVVGEEDDGIEAVSLAQRLQPDVILLDLMIKGMSGIEVARHLSKSGAGRGIIVFSVLGSQHHVLEAFRAGARGYVLKEAPSDELIQAIREVAQGRKYLCAILREQLSPHHIDIAESDNLYEKLTQREREILQLCLRGDTSAALAAQLNISRRTVETHRANIMRKLGLSRLSELYLHALQQDMLLDQNQYSLERG